MTIETSNRHFDAPPDEAEMTPGDYVMIAVSDSGAGMSEEILPRVFEPFFTTKEVGKGTGLGLSMVYGFVKQSGGHVGISSTPDEGTTVRIWLPRHQGAGAPEGSGWAGGAPEARPERRQRPAESDQYAGGGGRPARARLYRRDSCASYRLPGDRGGGRPRALALLQRPENRIALLFTDVVMPTFSGRELADRARALRPDLKILYTSGYARDAITHDGRLEPGVALIPKPFTYQALADKIAKVLE